MPLRFKVYALRDYMVVGDDEEPATWSEYMDPEKMSYMGGWLTEPTDDPGEPEVLTMSFAQLAEFLVDWHGDVWSYHALPNWADVSRFPKVQHGEYSTECYATGRESVDRLFIERS